MTIGLPPTTPHAANGRRAEAVPGTRRSRWRRLPRLVRWGVPLLGLLLILFVVLRLASPPPAQPAASPTDTATTARLIAHGVVQPVSQARVGTLGGGVLLSLSANVGDSIDGQRELARVRGASDVEVLTAPFAGTVTGIVAHVGDTLVPGATVVTVADLSRLQVETTDVDEFLINHMHPGDSVTLQIEALDARPLSGRVKTVALQPQTNTAGDQHYPVTIDFSGAQTDLRPGMSVRITLPG